MGIQEMMKHNAYTNFLSDTQSPNSKRTFIQPTRHTQDEQANAENIWRDECEWNEFPLQKILAADPQVGETQYAGASHIRPRGLQSRRHCDTKP